MVFLFVLSSVMNVIVYSRLFACPVLSGDLDGNLDFLCYAFSVSCDEQRVAAIMAKVKGPKDSPVPDGTDSPGLLRVSPS